MMESTSKRTWRATGTPGRRVAGLALVWLALVAVPAAAQVPQDIPFTGRLVDDAGMPLASPVTFDLWIYDDETVGVPGSVNSLYAERHDSVTLDANGNFSVLLGSGADCTACPGFPFPPFDAALFAGVERHVEVVLILPTFQFLTPRVPLASVPWALVAQQANAIVRDPGARFEDCGDGTVADHQTGLQWEKKTGGLGSDLLCRVFGCPDPHKVINIYTWSGSAPAPDGGAFTDFLQKLNDPLFGDVSGQAEVYGSPPSTGCFAGHCDWRLPIIDELGTILIGPTAAPGQATTCPVAPCIDPDFAAIGGPTGPSLHWSASTNADNTIGVWAAHFSNGNVFHQDKAFNDLYVRAVRAGSCK